MKGQNNFWEQIAFLTCSRSSLISSKLEQLEFKLEKNIGIKKHEKLEKVNLLGIIGLCTHILSQATAGTISPSFFFNQSDMYREKNVSYFG